MLRIIKTHFKHRTLVFFGILQLYHPLINAQFAPAGVKGKLYKDGTFIAGATGADWTPPLPKDVLRVNRAMGGNSITDWQTTSWKDVSCCQSMNHPAVWEDPDTGVPDCICRDIVVRSFYKTSAFCMLEQACANALRDFNKVFGEGYMLKGLGLQLDTESPARTCGADGAACGSKSNDPSKAYTDPFGRAVAPSTLPSPTYGRAKGEEIQPISTTLDPLGYFAKLTVQTHRWTPGDAPAAAAPFIGPAAGDGRMDAGIMAGTAVYPGTNHSACCAANATSDCCRWSARARWVGPPDTRQADCMYAVRRAVCAYHFWECDASLPDKMYNGVCKHTCEDIPKLCGTIPNNGNPLTLQDFTLGGFHYLGCTDRTRRHVRDCTAAAPPRPAAALLRAVAVVAAAAAAAAAAATGRRRA